MFLFRIKIKKIDREDIVSYSYTRFLVEVKNQIK